jgi:hypothetical protein
MILKIQAALAVIFILFPAFSYAQDCCGPGGGGGGLLWPSSSEGGTHYRIKGVRHYSYSLRHPGFKAGLESGSITDLSTANFTPRLEYSNTFGSLEIYGGLFYTFFLDAPYSHQIDLCENISWKIAPADNTRLVFRLDNENIFVFFPEESGFKYSAVDPSAAWNAAFDFGDIMFSAGFPVIVTKESGQSGIWFCAGYEHPIGLSISLCPMFLLLPDAIYNGTTLTLSFVWDTFFVKAALLVNKDISDFQIHSYLEYTVKHIVLWGGVKMSGIGKDDFFANLFVGAGYNF